MHNNQTYAKLTTIDNYQESTMKYITFVTLLLNFLGILTPIPVTRRNFKSFKSIGCTGGYSKFTEKWEVVESICRDCAAMYPQREEFVYASCRVDCYQNKMFHNCVKQVQLEQELKDYRKNALKLIGKMTVDHTTMTK